MKNLKNFEGPRQLRWRQKRTEKVNQNKRVSSQNKRVRKEEGATVAATPTFSHTAGCFVRRLSGRTGSVPTETFNFTGKSHKIPQMSYLRRETRNAGDFQIFN
jgi:hypothetical protein